MRATWFDLWCYIVVIIDFYALPLVMRDTGSAVVLMLIAMPLVLFATSVAYGLRHGWRYQYPIIVALLFVPTIFIFYNSSALIYIIVYGIIAVLGDAFGHILVPLFRKE
ncbi:hypothetical protein [Bifidobacterium oedipodis]|uniref:Exosortase n=1 Tax=Bifidobacterium oedipodis TaxID=2675322 RepID=A0A7Y0EQ32_9BIFI|nr:hypothetical protein [Bifidobacterium sp. DSM 109957]NMM94371.1 exosortase [Bifidobacterium sp. DSM 109957]